MTATNKKYPNQAKEAGKEAIIRHLNLGVDAGKRLQQWRKHNPELYLKSLQKAGRITQKLYPAIGHNNGKLVQQLYPEISKRLPYYKMQWKTFHPEKHFDACSGGGKQAHKTHPNMASEIGKKVHKMYPNMAKDNQKKACKNFPGLWNKIMSKMMNDWKNNDPKSFYAHQKEAGKLGGVISWDARYKNASHVWDNVKFLSNEEMQVAKIILDTPVKGKNCHMLIDRKEIDFYLEDTNLFVEYHPWDWNGLSKEQYYNQRRQIIDASCHSDADLIVITSLEEAKQMTWIKEEC